MNKNLVRLEVFGLILVISFSVFLQNLYTLCSGTLVGIMFGSVNDSIWETTKTILISYIIWSIIEAMCVRLPFHRFAVAKVISLYFLGVFYILACLVFRTFDSESYTMPEFTAAIIAVIAASFLSCRLMQSTLKLETLFMPAVFMLLLFLALYCSFTPFPPQNVIFLDRTTGLYGIIPDYIDSGASVLDTLFQSHAVLG